MLNNMRRNVRASIYFHSDEKCPVIYVTNIENNLIGTL